MHRRTADDQIGLSGTTRGKPAGPRSLIRPQPVRDRQRRFGPPAPNRLWVADLTWRVRLRVLPTPTLAGSWAGGSCYDGHLHGPRRDRASRLDPPTEGVLDLKDVIHHTDRGSVDPVQRAARRGRHQPSVGAVGSSYDNALAETIKAYTRPS